MMAQAMPAVVKMDLFKLLLDHADRKPAVVKKDAFKLLLDYADTCHVAHDVTMDEGLPSRVRLVSKMNRVYKAVERRLQEKPPRGFVGPKLTIKKDIQCPGNGCTRQPWNGLPGQRCCRSCKKSGGERHGPDCERKHADANERREKILKGAQSKLQLRPSSD